MAGDESKQPGSGPAALAAWREQRWKFHLAVSLAIIGAPLSQIGLTVALVGFHRSPDTRSQDSWGAWLTVGVLAFLVVLGAARLGSGVPRNPVRRSRELRAEAAYAPVRRAYFGPKTPWAVAVAPALGTFPVIFAESALLPQDPATGQAGVDTGAMTTGLVLAVGVLLLRELTGRTLTLLGVTAWCAWAWFAQDAQQPTAGWVGAAGIAAVLVALGATILERRFLRLHG
jgi:hypothetical protein